MVGDCVSLEVADADEEVSSLLDAAVEFEVEGANVELPKVVEFVVGAIVELDVDGAVGTMVGATLGESVGGVVVGESVVHRPHALTQ